MTTSNEITAHIRDIIADDDTNLISSDNLDAVLSNQGNIADQTLFVWAAGVGSESVTRHFLPRMTKEVITKAAYKAITNPIFNILADVADFSISDSEILFELTKYIVEGKNDSNAPAPVFEKIFHTANVSVVRARLIADKNLDKESLLRNMAEKMSNTGHYTPSEQDLIIGAIIDDDDEFIRTKIIQSTDMNFQASQPMRMACKLNRGRIAKILLPHSVINNGTITECVTRKHNSILEMILPHHQMSAEEINRQILDSLKHGNTDAIRQLLFFAAPEDLIDDLESHAMIEQATILKSLHQAHALKMKTGTTAAQRKAETL